MVKIIFFPLARFDLKEIIDFIKRDSLHYAILESKKIQGAINGLTKHPLMGRMFRKLKMKDTENCYSGIIESSIVLYLKNRSI